MAETPFSQIKTSLSDVLSENMINILPDKWEKIGDILVVKLSASLEEYKNVIGEKYAQFLSCKTVLQDKGGIVGTFRVPDVEVIFGDEKTVTVHRENGIRFKLDPSKVMFSSGNMDERIRMANISKDDEVVVDLFAGIGYFCIPLAVYRSPRKVFACEVNPVAFGFLCDNVVLNDVSSFVEPLLGDNRKVAPDNVADRVIMGFLRDNYSFLGVGLSCLRNRSGFIHFHDLCPNELLPGHPLDKIRAGVEKFGLKVELQNFVNVKSYAPGVSHVVYDLWIG